MPPLCLARITVPPPIVCPVIPPPNPKTPPLHLLVFISLKLPCPLFPTLQTLTREGLTLIPTTSPPMTKMLTLWQLLTPLLITEPSMFMTSLPPPQQGYVILPPHLARTLLGEGALRTGRRLASEHPEQPLLVLIIIQNFLGTLPPQGARAYISLPLAKEVFIFTPPFRPTKKRLPMPLPPQQEAHLFESSFVRQAPPRLIRLLPKQAAKALVNRSPVLLPPLRIMKSFLFRSLLSTQQAWNLPVVAELVGQSVR